MQSNYESSTHFSFHRERQDTDGQMKELQDQLEAEQYFSVSLISDHRCGWENEDTFIWHFRLFIVSFI